MEGIDRRDFLRFLAASGIAASAMSTGLWFKRGSSLASMREKFLDDRYGLMILVNNMEQGIEIVNQICPEHLELALKDPLPWLGKIRSAGSIFLGYYTPESVGDYIAGPNHVLPTGGTARFFSALGVDDFVKRTGISFYSQNSFREMGEKAVFLAEVEGLDAHAHSIRHRLNFIQKKIDL